MLRDEIKEHKAAIFLTLIEVKVITYKISAFQYYLKMYQVLASFMKHDLQKVKSRFLHNVRNTVIDYREIMKSILLET